MNEEDREILVGENRLYLGEDNILYEILVGKQNEKTAIAIREASDKLKDMVEGKVDVLVDINKAGKPTPEARRIAKRMLEAEGIGKVAIFGIHPVARVIASFVIGVTKKEDMHFFKTKEEAFAWLMEDKK